MKKYLSGLKGGADLLHPKLSPMWIIMGVFSVVALLAILAGGKYVYAKIGRVAQGLIPAAENVDYKARLGI